MAERRRVATNDGRRGLQPTTLVTRRAFLALVLAGGSSLVAACQQPTTPTRSADPRIGHLKPPEPKPAQAPPALGAARAAAGKPDDRVAGSPPAPAGPPKLGGTMTWAIDADPLDLDPHTSAGDAAALAWGDLTYQSLVMFDEHLKIVPCLAEGWRLADDRLTWTLKLRRGVTFHDGSTLDAEDVSAWFARIMASETTAPYRGWFSPITRVEPKGASEVAFHLSGPHAPLLATLAGMRGSAIVPRGWMQRAGAAMKTSALGSGPFKITEYVPGRHIRYVKHPRYWEHGLPYLDAVTLSIVPNEDERAARLRSGGVTRAALGPAAAQRLKNDRTVLSSPAPVQRVTIMNTQRTPFDDVRVRQAIALAVDRQAAIQQVLGGEGSLTGPMPTGHGDWPIPPESLPYRPDLARARQLLADAGHPDGFESTIVTTADSPPMLGTSLLLAEQLRALGITLRVEHVGREALAQAISSRRFDLASHTIGFLPDPDGYFTLNYRSNGAHNISSWQNARYDEIVDQARTVMDPGVRKRLYDEAAGLLLNEAPLIWWFAEHAVDVIHASVKGYRPSFSGLLSGLKRTWLDS